MDSIVWTRGAPRIGLRAATGVDAGGAAFVLALALLAITAVAAVGYATREGMGLSTDSNLYLQAARHLGTGEGFTVPEDAGTGRRPLTHFPPLYPLFLAALAGVSGLGLQDAARALNAGALAATVALAGVVFRRGAGLPRAAALLGAAVVAVSTDLVHVHAMVWSEATFIFFLLATIALLSASIELGGRRLLVAAGVATALSLMTRYAGAGLVLGAVVALLACGRGTGGATRSWRRRATDAAVFGAVACLPAAAWAVRNVVLTGRAANRQLAFHPPSLEAWTLGREVIAAWIWPASSLGVLGLVVLACVSARNAAKEGRPPRAVVVVAACMGVAYALFLITSITFADAATPLDDRILAPLRVSLAVAVFGELARSSLPPAVGRRARAAWPVTMVALAVVVVAGQAVGVRRWVRAAPEGHLAFGTRGWRNMELLQFVDRLPADAVVYSNSRHVIELHTARVVREVPKHVDATTGEPLPDVRERLSRFGREVRRSGAYVVYFRKVVRHQLVPEETVRREIGLTAVYRSRDGTVYRAK